MMGLLNFLSFKNDAHSQFEQLLAPHIDQLYRLAYRLSGQRDDAEDLVQDLLLKIYPRLDELKNIEKPGPWLSRVLYRLFLDGLRQQQRSPIDYTGDDSVYEEMASDNATPEEAMNREITQKQLSAAIDTLSDEHRSLILLHDVEGYNLQEIYDMTDIPIGTIKSRLSRARTKLREILNIREPNLTESVNTSERVLK